MIPPKLLVFEWYNIVRMRCSLVFVRALSVKCSQCLHVQTLHTVWWKSCFLYKEEANSHLLWTFAFLIFRHHLSPRVQTTLHQWWLSSIISWQIIISRTKNSPRPLNFTCTTFVSVQTGQYYGMLLHVLHSSLFFQHWKADSCFQEWKKIPNSQNSHLQSIITCPLYN